MDTDKYTNQPCEECGRIAKNRLVMILGRERTLCVSCLYEYGL